MLSAVLRPTFKINITLDHSLSSMNAGRKPSAISTKSIRISFFFIFFPSQLSYAKRLWRVLLFTSRFSLLVALKDAANEDAAGVGRETLKRS